MAVFAKSFAAGMMAFFCALSCAVRAVSVSAAEVRVVDMDAVMALSDPGRVISAYVADYCKVMDVGMRKLDEAAAAAEKGKNLGLAASLRNDRQNLIEQKQRVKSGGADYMRSIVAELLKRLDLPGGTMVLNAKDAAILFCGSETDMTQQVIELLKGVTPSMPELPKLSIPEAKPAPAAKKPAPAKKPAAAKKPASSSKKSNTRTKGK